MVAKIDSGSDDFRTTLAIGMYCQTELPVRSLVDALLVPRHAIHENRWVYVFEPSSDDPEGRAGRLGRRQIPMLRSVGDSVLVDYREREGTESCELKPGEQLVVSPLITPVVGMEIRLRDEQVTTGAPLRTAPDDLCPAPKAYDSARGSAAVLGRVGPIRGGG